MRIAAGRIDVTFAWSAAFSAMVGLLACSNPAGDKAKHPHTGAAAAQQASPSVTAPSQTQQAVPAMPTTPQAAQRPTPTAKDPWADRTDLISAPEVKPAGALRLPRRRRARLTNGLSVLMVPDRRLPLVTVSLVLRVGGIDDPPGKVGLAEFTSDMLRQGVRGMSADKLSARVDTAGASLGASAGYEFTRISCSARARSLGLCLNMVAQLVIQPTFPGQEMRQVRQRLLGSVKRLRDNPHALVALHFDNLLYGDDHPGGRPMTATSVAAIARKDVVGFHKTHYLPQVAMLAVSGDFDPKVAMRRIRANYSRWMKRQTPRRRVRPVRDPQRGFKLLLVDKPDLSQAFFALGHAGIHFGHPRRDAIRVVNFVLGGGGFSSRLMKQVRSLGGKTYGISSRFSTDAIDGSFSVHSFTRNEEIVNTLKIVRKELQRIRTSAPTEAEIRAAQGRIAGGYVMRYQTAADVASALVETKLRGLGESYVTELPLRVQRVDPALAADVARLYVRPHRLVGAIVGKAAVVAPLLKAAGYTFTTISFTDPISARARQQASLGKKSDS